MKVPAQDTAIKITRHFVDIPGEGHPRRVHYRKAGSGPPVLLVHQSPRSSAEYEALMRDWAPHFTCIAPDSPGFGQSDPFPGTAEVDAFADGAVAFLDALGIERCGAFGFHSGAIILIAAVRRHPGRFSAVAAGGYGVWTPQEMALFGESYMPPFRPEAYGEHLVWLWNRILEQTWFFPWFDPRPETRLPRAHDNPAAVDAVVREMLDAGDHYRSGYGAVMRAPRNIPPPDGVTPPVLLTAYTGDPMLAHLERFGEMPANWTAYAVATPAAQQDASLAFLRDHAEAGDLPGLNEADDEGFLPITTEDFEGLIHWRGVAREGVLHVHGPGRALDLVPAGNGLWIDLPGHGLSDRWAGEPPCTLAAWDSVIAAVSAHFGTGQVAHEPVPVGDPEQLFPDLTPDRFGQYLVRAWAIVRARHFFVPWYAAGAAQAVAFEPADISPDRLALEHRALIRGTAARAWAIARQTGQTS